MVTFRKHSPLPDFCGVIFAVLRGLMLRESPAYVRLLNVDTAP